MMRQNTKKRVLDENLSGPAKRAKSGSDAGDHEQSNDSPLGINGRQKAIPKVTKKPAVRTSRVNRKKAEKKDELVGLMDTPIDIFYEILSYLLPADLLALSRVCIRLRELMLSRCNRQIWVTSLALTDLPPCPRDLVEPQYASLIFDTGCFACGSPRIKTLYYEYRLRLCKKCYNSNIKSFEIIYKEFEESLSLDISSKVLEIIKEVALNSTLHSWKNGRRMYYKPALLGSLAEWLSRYQSEPKKKFDALVKERALLRHNIDSHTLLLLNWVEKQKSNHSLKLWELSDESSLTSADFAPSLRHGKDSSHEDFEKRRF